VVSEDLPVTYRIAMDAGKIGMLDKRVYYYFHREGSITTAAFSPKALQPSDHTEKILTHVRREYPALSRYAASFHVSHLGYVCMIMELAGKDVLDQYAEEYRSKCRKLRRMLPEILTNPLIKKKDRLTWITICCGCYGSLRKVYHIGREK